MKPTQQQIDDILRETETMEDKAFKRGFTAGAKYIGIWALCGMTVMAILFIYLLGQKARPSAEVEKQLNDTLIVIGHMTKGDPIPVMWEAQNWAMYVFHCCGDTTVYVNGKKVRGPDTDTSGVKHIAVTSWGNLHGGDTLNAIRQESFVDSTGAAWSGGSDTVKPKKRPAKNVRILRIPGKLKPGTHHYNHIDSLIIGADWDDVPGPLAEKMLAISARFGGDEPIPFIRQEPVNVFSDNLGLLGDTIPPKTPYYFTDSGLLTHHYPRVTISQSQLFDSLNAGVTCFIDSCKANDSARVWFFDRTDTLIQIGVAQPNTTFRANAGPVYDPYFFHFPEMTKADKINGLYQWGRNAIGIFSDTLITKK